jgi:pyruvate dehydrogenase E2 component (dihydrolipoamide acetyltransferase)
MAEIIVMPKMNLTMEEGVLVDWCKKLGEHVKAEEILCNIETEKSVAEMESPASGVLLKIWGVEGERYQVATPIALIGEPDEDVSDLIAQAEKLLAGTPPSEPVEETPPVASVVPAAPLGTRVQVKMLPKVRKLAQDLGVDIPALAAYCGDRKITEEEVRAFHQASPQTGATDIQLEPGDRRVRMSTMRRTIAANMSESSQKTAHLTNVTEVDMTGAVDILYARKDVGLSLTALVVKACALAIKDHDIINTVVDGEEIIYKAGIHVGVAVDVPGGLVVPVIRAADTKDIPTLSREIADLAAKARQGALSQDDLTGGTFTVSNAGMLGLEIFTPIINFPQTAIMGVGAVARLPRYLDDTSNTIVSRYIMKLCLTYDHRVIDGAPAARFSLRVRDLLQNPEELLA